MRQPCGLIMAFNHQLIKLQTFNIIIMKIIIMRLWKRLSRTSCINVTKLIQMEVEEEYQRSNRTRLARKTLTINLLNWQCLLRLRTHRSCLVKKRKKKMKSLNWRSLQANKARRKLQLSPQFQDRALRFFLGRVMNGLINVSRNSRRRWSRAGSEFRSKSLQVRTMGWKKIRTIWLTMRHSRAHPAAKCQDVCSSLKRYHSKTKTK